MQGRRACFDRSCERYQCDAGIQVLFIACINTRRPAVIQVDLRDIQVFAVQPESLARLIDRNINGNSPGKSVLRRVYAQFQAIMTGYDSIAQPADGEPLRLFLQLILALQGALRILSSRQGWQMKR